MDLKEMQKLIEKEGNFLSNIYKGIKYEVIRHKTFGHLCGYLYYTPKNEHERELIDTDFHCGITYENDGVIGFDCGHAIDNSPLQLKIYESTGNKFPILLNPEYRTMKYVEDILKKTIDNIVSGKNEKPEQSYEWEYDKLQKIKEEQDKNTEQALIEKMVKTIRKGNFTVISDERLSELHTKEKTLEKLSGGMVSLCEEVLDVIDHD